MSKEKIPNPWYVGVVSGMASYIDSAAIISNGTALVIYQKTIGITAVEIGILSGLLTLAIALGAFSGGRLGDRLGRRKVFIFTMLMIVMGTLLLAFGLNFPLLLLGTLLVGLATGADLPVSLATISEAANDENRGKIIGLSNMLWTVGIGVTIAISSIVGDWGKLGAQILFLHVCLVSAIVLLLRLSIPESPLWLVARDELKRGVATVRAQTSSYKDLLRGKYLWPFIALSVFYTFTNLAANTGGQFGAYIAVNVVGISISTSSLWGLCMMPVGLFFNLFFMRIVDTPKRMTFFVIGALAMVAGYLILPVLRFTPAALLGSMFLLGVGNGLAFEGIMKVWAQESFPTMLRSTAQGLIVAIARLTCGVLAFVTPVLLDAGPVIFYLLLVTIVSIGLVAGWLCFHGTQRNEFNAEAEALDSVSDLK